MGFIIDIHVHSQRHSGCSRIAPERLIQQAIARGLHGLIITDHHYQWSEEELETLRQASGETAFLLMAGFEYSTCAGDILVYGLAPELASTFVPYQLPTKMLTEFQGLGALCIAAHPTRAGMGFDPEIATMPFDAIEVRSVNLQPNEQRMAIKLAKDLSFKSIVASDAHRLNEIGTYTLEFDAPLRHMADFSDYVRKGAYKTLGPRP